MVHFTSSLLQSKGWRQTLQYTSLLQVLGLSLCAVLIKSLYTFTHITTSNSNSNSSSYSVLYGVYNNAKVLMHDRHFFYLAMGYMVCIVYVCCSIVCHSIYT